MTKPQKNSPQKTRPGSKEAAFNPYQSWLGISFDDGIIDHYRLLNLDNFESDRSTIEEAADAQMKRVRVHQTGRRGELTQVLLKQIVEAKLCLLNNETKQAYDQHLQNNLQTKFHTDSNPHVRVIDPPLQVKTVHPLIDESASPYSTENRQESVRIDKSRMVQPRNRFPWEVVVLFASLMVAAVIAIVVVWLVRR